MDILEILVLGTGGSIDKDYMPNDDNHGLNFEISWPAVEDILNRACHLIRVVVKSILKKDSLHLKKKDLKIIKREVKEAVQKYIIITHGTDTIKKTAKFLSSIKGKTIILTGSRFPEKFRENDADFNVGMAVGAIPHLKPGVYIALNGRVVPWDEYED